MAFSLASILRMCHIPGIILTHWGRDKMAAISQTMFSNAFSWMKIYQFRLGFHWSLFPRVQLTISQQMFRLWLGAVQATSHYLNQWWLVYRRIYASFGLNELNAWVYVKALIFRFALSLKSPTDKTWAVWSKSFVFFLRIASSLISAIYKNVVGGHIPNIYLSLCDNFMLYQNKTEISYTKIVINFPFYVFHH